MRQLSLCLLVCGCAHATDPARPTATAAPVAATAAPTAPPATAAPAPAPRPPESLYERLGGHDAVVAVVDDFVLRNVTDPRVKERFFNTDAARLEQLLVEFVSMATGGPSHYSGRDMPSSHAGMELVDEEFDAVVGNLKATLDKFKVPPREQGELLGALGPLKPQIVVAPGVLQPLDPVRLDAAARLAATLQPKAAAELLSLAVTAGRRGQRSYAEQLFSRAELQATSAALASVAATFRDGAPPRVQTALVKATDATPQPKTAIGSSDEDEPVKVPARGSLRGVVRVDGKALTSFGVVMLEPLDGKFTRRQPRHRVIEQRDRQFAPHVMAVPVGSTVSFPNFDPVFHNVFSVSKLKPFDLGLYKDGDQRQMTFDKEGILTLGCNLHSSMSAFLVVVAAPHYVVTGSDGSFYFKSLKPGKYRMKTWTDRSGEPMLTTIEVKAGTNQSQVELRTDEARVASNIDKFGRTR